ncbi:MAG: hypothetical protein M3169_05865 [Candidatus Eremiobacteraeota bacterium]|nr:hypothetical protein [Candidatus Eremiobacteraeota bacterium]
MTSSRVFATALLTAAAVFANALSCGAAPTPIPGGANQVKAVSGTVGEPMWNGVVRLKVRELRVARPDEHPETLLPGPDQKVMVFDAMLRNGTASQFAELLTYTLADKDDVVFEIPSQYLKPVPLVVAQGSAAHIRALFLADKNFVPVKLLIQCATCGTPNPFGAFRVQIPAAPAPAASP